MLGWPLLAALLAVAVPTFGQSNYGSQANNVEYQGTGLPEQATLDGKVTRLDDLQSVIFLNRTRAALNCASGSMQIELKFSERFYGRAFADFDRHSACQVTGKGDLSYKLELPLKGCGTKQEPTRVFTNNIVVRFHPHLEMDGDEVITIVCRYPPPVAPPPAAAPPLYRQDVAPAAALAPPLNGFQILLIICGILFLSLLLLGLGCSYYCLRRRPLTVVRRQPFAASMAEGSEITKLSGSSLGNLSMFEGLKIPRAHAPVALAGSSTGSEGLLISDTLPSDYPSESHSEAEDVDTRSLPVSSAGSFDNKAYVQEQLLHAPSASSYYSDGYGHTQELLAVTAAEQPRFDVQVRVKRAPPPPPSPSITSDAESSIARTERNLSTILEQREDSVRTVESPLPPGAKTQFSYVPELHAPPKYIQPAPVYNRILRRQQEQLHDTRDQGWDELDATRSLASLNTEMTDTHSFTELVDDSHHRFVAPAPPPPPPIAPLQHGLLEMREETFPVEPPIAASYRKPEITSHVVDDVFLRTITEKRTVEDIERHKRLVTEYRARPVAPPVDQRWDVTIRNYPAESGEPPEWENFSDISSASGLTLTPKPERALLSLPPQSRVRDNKTPLFSPELVGNIGYQPQTHSETQQTTYTATHHQQSPPTYLTTFDIPLHNPEVPNWDVLIRVFQPLEQQPPHVFDTTEAFNTTLTTGDKIKWRKIITSESTLRTLLTEAVVREDFERIRHDQRYQTIFEPPKWDVIIRVLAPPPPGPQPPARKGSTSSTQQPPKKKGEWETRSRRSSLPTLYEYDSDGGSSVRTLTNEPPLVGHHTGGPSGVGSRSRRTSRSSYRSDAIDMRSMSEMTVDFARPDHLDSQSEGSSYFPGQGGGARYFLEDSEPELELRRSASLTRSLSQPSLARSASEFTERWVAPPRYDTASEFTSPETTPKSQRSARIQAVHVPRGLGATSGNSQQRGWQPERAPGVLAVTTQMQSSQYMETSTSFRSKDWFADNDSEASFK